MNQRNPSSPPTDESDEDTSEEPRRENAFTRGWDRLDATLSRLQRHCPKCGGGLNRRFSLLDKIGLYLPIPHTIYATHECEQCHTRYRSFRSLTDLFLEASWVGALFCLGEWKFIAIVCPLTWLIVSYLLKNGAGAGTDTVVAGVLTGILWFLALVFGNPTRGDFLMSHPALAMPLLLLLIVGPIWIVLALDRYTSFQLEECHAVGEPQRGG